MRNDRETNFADALLGVGDDDAVAVVEPHRAYTYAELRAAAARLAGELAALGLPAGARIGLLGGNSFFWVAAYLAAMKVGVVVPLPERASTSELEAQANWVRCRAMLIDRRNLARVAGLFPGRPVVTDASLEAPGSWPWPLSATANDDAALMFTSGTTARPKAVRITHINLSANTTSIISYLGLRADDRMLVILPFSYVFGASLLHTHLAVGGSVAICNTFTFPETALDMIEAHACTGLAGVPSSFQLLLRASGYASRRLPTLRQVQQAGGRLAPPLVRELVAAQPAARLFVMYGQTEATARLSYLPPELLTVKEGSIGRGIPGVTLSVLDEAGMPVGPGQQGEIFAEGLNISPGYVDDEEATRAKFPGGLLRTGDLATLDEDGYVYIVGRSGDFIKTWGYRVAPQLIEELAVQHRGVAAAAVVGVPDPDAGEAVALAVVPAPGSSLDLAALMAMLRAGLPKYAVPQHLHVLDALPLNGSGKVSRPALRELLGVGNREG